MRGTSQPWRQGFDRERGRPTDVVARTHSLQPLAASAGGDGSWTGPTSGPSVNPDSRRENQWANWNSTQSLANIGGAVARSVSK